MTVALFLNMILIPLQLSFWVYCDPLNALMLVSAFLLHSKSYKIAQTDEEQGVRLVGEILLLLNWFILRIESKSTT